MKRIVIIPVLLIGILSYTKGLGNKLDNRLLKIVIENTEKPKLPQKGKASYYSNKYSGRATFNAQKYNPATLTAAHESLPMGTKVKVTNLKNSKSVIVTINDRCACSRHGRIIDVSMNAAEQLNMISQGVARVKIEKYQ
jgi:rare lipoprotein A